MTQQDFGGNEQTYVADEPFEENKFSLQLLHAQSQLILTHLALLQVLKNTHTHTHSMRLWPEC